MKLRQAKKIHLSPPNHRRSSVLEAEKIWKKRYPLDVKVGDHIVEIGCGCSHIVTRVGNKFIQMVHTNDEDKTSYPYWRHGFEKEHQILNQGDECQFCKSRGQDHWATSTPV